MVFKVWPMRLTLIHYTVGFHLIKAPYCCIQIILLLLCSWTGVCTLNWITNLLSFPFISWRFGAELLPSVRHRPHLHTVPKPQVSKFHGLCCSPHLHSAGQKDSLVSGFPKQLYSLIPLLWFRLNPSFRMLTGSMNLLFYPWRTMLLTLHGEFCVGLCSFLS